MQNRLRKALENSSISKLNTIISFSFTTSILLFAVLLILQQQIEFENDLQKFENEFINLQKESLKKETNRALRFIEFKKKELERSEKSFEEVKKEIVDAVEQMRNERDGSGYIFIYTDKAINIADPILKQNAGKDLSNFQDINGKFVIKELIDVSKKDDGGFVEYVWNKPTTNKPSPKISFAKFYQPFGWMVGTGIYLDDMYKELELKKLEYKQRINNYIFQVILFSSILFIVMMFVSRYFSSILNREIDRFIDFFKTASIKHLHINLDELVFKEFKSIAEFANLMVSEIWSKNEKLSELNIELDDLNKHLEDRVNQKTIKLQMKNKELEESQQTILKLYKAQDNFIKNSIHEINTPLAIILTNIDLLILNSGRNRHLTKIEAAAKIINSIYNDLSYFVKKDRVEYKKSEINLSQYLHDRCEYFDEIAKVNGLLIERNIVDNIWILANDVELQRIIDNNISNAIKYSFNETVIKIKLFENIDYIIMEFENVGKEIKEPNMLFERFYREDSARGGFGLGLNIVSQICSKNNYLIEVSSKKGKNGFLNCFKYKFNKTLS